ncbi:ATP-binding protein [Haloarcula halophila]|uniref:ATP-binding protein n=1 Tax=Haloarcula TaxID=2237 RepID=UPI0023E3BCA0|nr:PAS domain-containing sensor histidine kinase [Halomicroarcula sp. DFY41]
MDRNELVSKFAETVGVEKAQSVVGAAIDAVGIEDDTSMTNTDARDVCEVIQHEHDGYLALVAGELRVHLEAQERFGALLGNIPDPAVVVEFDKREPRVTSVNEAFETAFGYDRSEAVGSLLSELVAAPGQTAGDIAENWLQDSAHSEQEVERATASGAVRTFLFRSVVVTREGGGVEGYGVYTDITERKRREQQLEHQNERLDEFVSIVSHDLRNPLSVAAGHTEQLRAVVDDPAANDHLDALDRAHDRMGALLEDLLELARQGQVVGQPEPVDLRSLATEAWEQVDTDGVTLSVDATTTVEADPERLQQLFENLFRNAVEHGVPDESTEPDGPEITVTVGTLGPTGTDGFYVADDGPGLPEGDHEQVFEHGYSTNPDGTGFGLSIVQNIAEAHGWHVTATESERGGARFEIRW